MKGSASFNRASRKDLTQLLLVLSAGGYASMMATFLLHSPRFAFDPLEVAIYQTLLPLFIFLFPFSLGLFLAVKRRMSMFIAAGILLLFAASFVFTVPVINAEIPLPCTGSYMQWQSIGYRLFRTGFHTWEIGCL